MELRIDKINSLPCIALALFIIQQVIGSSNIDDLPGIPLGLFCATLKWAAVALILAKLVFETYTSSEFISIILISILSVVSYLCSGSDYILFLTIFIIGAKGTDYYRLCETVIKAYTPCIIFVAVLAITGVIENTVISSGYNVLTGSIALRNSFGFQHANFLGGYFLQIYIALMYIRSEKYKWLDFIYSMIAVAFLLFVVNSRTAAVVILIMTILLLFEHILKKYNTEIITKICLIIMLLTVVLSFLSAYMYDSSNTNWTIIDTLLSKRFSQAHYFIENYSITLFGQNLTFVSSVESALTGSSLAALDNGFIHLLLRYGVLEFFVLLGMYFMIFFKCKKKNSIVCIGICAIFICAISEKWLFMVGYNILPLLFFAETSNSFSEVTEIDEG